MHVAVMYSGVGGPNGADYVAEMLANGFRDAGVRVSMIGQHGGYPTTTSNIVGKGGPSLEIPAGVDFVVQSSGFNLTPALVALIHQTCPVFMWTFTDEIQWWRDRIFPLSSLVDIHYSYTKAHGFGPHVRYLPLAADPTMYHPERIGYGEDHRDVDICMIGAARRYRVGLCEALAKRFPKSYFSWRMSVPVAHIRNLYARTKVVLATVQDCDEDVPGRAWGCPCRTFDVRACNAFQLEVERGGLFEAYPNAAMMAPFPDVALAAEAWGSRIQALLDNPAAREDQARQDYTHTLSYHLYRHRAEQMVADFRAMGRK